MPSTFSSLKIELIATGEQSGTWGVTTNTNLGTAIEEAITGSADVTFTSGSDTTITLTDTNAAQAARNLRLNLVGTSNAPQNLILGSGCQIEKLYLINNTLGHAITVKNTTGTGIAVPAGKKAILYNNGTNVLNAVDYFATADIAGGTINNTIIGGTTPAAGTFTQVNITGQGDLRLEDTTGGEYVALQAPSTLASSYTLTLPVDDGTNGQALITDGNGVLSWSTAASGDVYGPASATANGVALFDGTTGKLLQSPSTITYASSTLTLPTIAPSGNLTFTGTGNRITGDFSNGTRTDRVAFQSSTTNGATRVGLIPNGTASQAIVDLYNGTDLNNTGTGQLSISSTEFTIRSAIFGTGTYVPMTFFTGGSERLRIDTSGNVGIGTSSPNTKLEVVGAVRATNSGSSGYFYRGYRSGTTSAWYVYDSGSEVQMTVEQANPLLFGTSNTERMRITPSGNVGITNTAPRRNLEVSGTIAAPTALATAITTSANGTVIISDSGGGTVGSVIGTALNGSSYDTYIQSRNMGAASTAYNLLLQPLGGGVGIGTTAPGAKLEVAGGVRLSQTGATPAGLDIGLNGGNGVTGFSSRDSSNNWRPLYIEANILQFFTGTVTERMRIDSSGNVLVGTTTAAYNSSGRGVIELNGSSNSLMAWKRGDGSAFYIHNNSGSVDIYNTANTSMNFATNNSERMRINSDGRLLLGTTSDGTGNPIVRATGGSNIIAMGSGQGCRWKSTGEDNFEFFTWTNTPNPNFLIGYGNGSGSVDTSKERVTVNAGTWAFQNSNLSISGSLSKGSGSFKIDHPLPEKTDTHFLVHSFIEAPQADLIYRGKVQLKNGKATVNIDTAARMSEGTFVLLCRDVQCFTSNESDWDAVRGSVSGNILTIECQNTSSTATISWMVIGERQDSHMYETDWTDNDGRIIVEPEKTIVDEKNIIFSGVIENA